MLFTSAISLPKIQLLLKHEIVQLAWRLPNLCNESSQRNTQIKLTSYDDTKKRLHDSQIVRAVFRKEESFSLFH